MAKKLKLEVEFTIPDSVGAEGEMLYRLGIRLKQLATDGAYHNGSADDYKGDLTIRNMRVETD